MKFHCAYAAHEGKGGSLLPDEVRTYSCRVILVKLCCACEVHVGKEAGSVLPFEVRTLILPC